MSRPRFGFLPIFFTVLGVVFVVAVFFRIRSYQEPERPLRGTVDATATTTSGDASKRRLDEQPIIVEGPASAAPSATSPPLLTTSRRTKSTSSAEPVTTMTAAAQKPSLFDRVITPV